MLADAYDAAIMTGAMVVDTHRVCQFALFRSVCVGGGGAPGKLSATYADLMTGVMVFTGGKGAGKLYSTLADAYAANNMTGVMVVDTTPRLSVCCVHVGGDP